MAESNMLEIIRGLQQAAANGYDGAMDEKGEPVKVGLKREEGHPIHDKRVNDGFKIKFMPAGICILYQSDVFLKDIYGGGFENEMARQINEIKKFLQKEYKKITGNSVTLTKDGDVQVMAQSTSRVRSFVNASQCFNVSGLKPDADAGGSENRSVDDAFRKFLELNNNNKRPSNDTRKR